MKIIILAAGQGTRLRPLTNAMPKCMVSPNGKSLVERQIDLMVVCGIKEKDIYIVCGYCSDALKKHLLNRKVVLVENENFETTNMVCSFMCAKDVISEDVIVSYGDIVYSPYVFKALLESAADISVVVDDDWQPYWAARGENWMSDAETLKLDAKRGIVEIGQIPSCLADIESQYIGLMRFKNKGVNAVLNVCNQAKIRSSEGKNLWRTNRDYCHMYMTDMLQGLIDEKYLITPVHISRGWYEIDTMSDFLLVEKELLAGEL